MFWMGLKLPLWGTPRGNPYPLCRAPPLGPQHQCQITSPLLNWYKMGSIGIWVLIHLPIYPLPQRVWTLHNWGRFLFLTRGGAAVATIFFVMELSFFVINENNCSIIKKVCICQIFLVIQQNIIMMVDFVRLWFYTRELLIWNEDITMYLLISKQVRNFFQELWKH